MSKDFVFVHQRMDVYHVAMQFVQFTDKLDAQWLGGNADRRRQLARAADSIVLNIAEGCSRGPGQARKNHYRIASGSAGECDAVLHLLEVRGAPVHKGRKLLSRIGAMLSRMS